jgi:hypothetical protein
MCLGMACSVTVRLQWLHFSIFGVSTSGRPVWNAFVMSEGGRLTKEGRSFFFSPDIMSAHRQIRLTRENIIPFPLSESQLPGFLTTGRLDLTSGFNFGDVTSSRDSNRFPSGLLSRFWEGAGAEQRVSMCAHGGGS